MKIPSGITINAGDGVINVKGAKGALSRKYDARTVTVTVTGDEIAFGTPAKKTTRSVNAAVNAIEAHVKHMCKGVTEGFTIKLTVVYSHFPITVEVKGAEVHVKNFLGEKSDRVARIMGATKVVVNKQDITVSGLDKEDVGQTAANIHQTTRIVGRDNRRFQDGIYLV